MRKYADKINKTYSKLIQELVEEELNGEGVELDLVSAMKELDIQENKSSSGDTTDSSVTQASTTSSEESCKVQHQLHKFSTYYGVPKEPPVSVFVE